MKLIIIDKKYLLNPLINNSNMHYFGIIVLVLGIAATVLNFLTMNSIKKNCNNKTIKEMNYGNIGVGIAVIIAGAVIAFYSSGTSHGFAFG